MAAERLIPYAEVDFPASYVMLDTLGFYQTLPMRDVYPDALPDVEANKEENKKVGAAYIETGPAYLLLLNDVLKPDDVVPLLWLDSETEVLHLRPCMVQGVGEYLSKEVTWRKGIATETAETLAGKGSGSAAPPPNQENPVYRAAGVPGDALFGNFWSPLDGTSYTDYWAEHHVDSKYFGDKPEYTLYRATVIENDMVRTIDEPWEHYLGSSEMLDENGSFALLFKVNAGHPNTKREANQSPPNYFAFYWGKRLGIRTDGHSLYFSPRAWATGGATDPQLWMQAVGVSLAPRAEGPLKGYAGIIIQVLANAIVISQWSGASDPKGPKTSWAYRFKDTTTLNNPDPAKRGLIVERAPMFAGVKAATVSWAYVPIVYPQTAALSTRPMSAGYDVSDAKVTADSYLNGGQIVTTQRKIPGSKTFEFDLSIELWRNETVATSTPQLTAVKMNIEPTTQSVAIRRPPKPYRLRSVSLNHEIFDQSGSMVLDASVRSGGGVNGTAIPDKGLLAAIGVFPVTIRAGWLTASGPQLATRFVGFAANSTAQKQSAPAATATFELAGRNQQFKDAKAINLPIYDGEIHIDAIVNLVRRAGWAGTVNLEPKGAPYFTDSSYRLSVPAKPGDAPQYMFGLGTPIWSCIEQISRPMGYWAYVDSLGRFNYVPPFLGNAVRTYREKPTVNGYDEWQQLQQVRDLRDVHNAVVVMGLDASFEHPKLLVSQRRALGPIGANGDEAFTSTNVNWLPWYKWLIVQDSSINDQAIVDWVAQRLFDNNNRPRWTVTGRVWGSNDIFPLDTIALEMADYSNAFHLPHGQWRVLSISETISGEDKTWTMDLTTEWVDPRYGYSAWWGRSAT